MRLMTIRLMQLSDYEPVYQLWLSCKGMGLNDLDDSQEGIARYLMRNPDTCFLAMQFGAVIDVILSGHDGRRGYIHHTAVHPAHRGQGVGAQLVRAALDALHVQGIHKVALVVFDHNEGGNRFWEKQGFTKREDLVYRNRALDAIERIDT